MRYETVIGLEVHAQLKTKTKIWCGCPTDFGEDANRNTCPVCTGMPGVLPVLNRTAVEYAIKMGLALGCRINPISIFARKNYFYPDLPMGYQISQYELPLAEHGRVAIRCGESRKLVGVTRIHLENDAGKSMHSTGENASYVDLNRAGVPLIEIVSEPDMRSPDEAVAYLKALHSVLLYLGICDGNMEEGSFRCDANVSLRPEGRVELGVRTEIKNMNSFRNVHRALELEIRRHRGILEDGEAVVQETRLYDAVRNETRSMRGKEEAQDYRYFPDPDLRPLEVPAEWVEAIRATLPELPGAKRERFENVMGLTSNDAEFLAAGRDLAEYFEHAVEAGGDPKRIANWITGEFMRILNECGDGLRECGLHPRDLATLVGLVDEEVVSGNVGKQVLRELFYRGGDPKDYVKKQGLTQVSDVSALEELVQDILDRHPEELVRLRNGDKKLMGFFVGQAMRASQGKADPKALNEILAKVVRS